MLALKILTVIIALLALLLSASVVSIKLRLGRAEKGLIEDAGEPRGGGIAHGMVFKDGERGVRAVDMRSDAWYVRMYEGGGV